MRNASRWLVMSAEKPQPVAVLTIGFWPKRSWLRHLPGASGPLPRLGAANSYGGTQLSVRQLPLVSIPVMKGHKEGGPWN